MSRNLGKWQRRSRKVGQLLLAIIEDVREGEDRKLIIAGLELAVEILGDAPDGKDHQG